MPAGKPLQVLRMHKQGIRKAQVKHGKSSVKHSTQRVPQR